MGLEDITALLRLEGAFDTDLVVLPEYWRALEQPEPLDGSTIQAVAEAARACGMYVVCPLDRLDENGRRLNSAVLISRPECMTSISRIGTNYASSHLCCPVQLSRYSRQILAAWGWPPASI